MAERTGLEPATPCVTGRYSNQLNYRSTESCHCTGCHSGLLLNLMPGSSLLSHGETPHYHRRYGVSLLSSAWGQVGPPRYSRQANSVTCRRTATGFNPSQAENLSNTTPKHLRRCKVKPHGSLVPVSSTHRCAYTPGLSTSSSSTFLQETYSLRENSSRGKFRA